METLHLNLSTVYKLLLPIASLWYQLGVALGLAPYLDKIKTNNHRDGQRLQAVLYHWENSTVRPYTWNTLIAALDSSYVGLKNLAAKMKDRIKITATVTLLWKPDTVCVWSPMHLLIGKGLTIKYCHVCCGVIGNLRSFKYNNHPFCSVLFIIVACNDNYNYNYYHTCMQLTMWHQVRTSCEIQGYCNVCGYYNYVVNTEFAWQEYLIYARLLVSAMQIQPQAL